MRRPAPRHVSYRLRDREGMADGVRRVVAEQLERAVAELRELDAEDRDAAVHDARKRLKKARSALRLARDDIGQDVRRPENAAMRDAARRLAGARDAQVLIETLDDLSARAGGPAPPAGAVRALRRRLVRDRDELAAATQTDEAASAAAAEIDGVLERSRGWPLDEDGFAAACAGLKRIYRRGRRAMGDAVEDGGDEAWHEWRKRVKDLWYSLRILRPVARAQLKGPADEADALSDVLGDHHDVAVLRSALDEHASELDPDDVERLREALDRRRDELRRAALPLGRRLYAERPGDFAARLGAYWDARPLQDAADATWLDPGTARRVRGLLAAKARADAGERRRASAELRRTGFRVADFAGEVPRRPGGFALEDFDRLVERGSIRVGPTRWSRA
jgi:CHAD domain-containing protein